MTYTARFSELHYPLVIAYSDSVGAGTHTSSYVSLANYHRAILVANIGDMGTNATLDIHLRQATTTAAGTEKAITGKAITQLTQAGGDGDDIVCIELQTEELDVDGGYDCVAVRDIVADAAVEFGYILYGIVPRFAPTATTNWTEIVT